MSRGARERGPPPAPPTFRGRGTGFRVLIKGLPISASWQDLKVSVNQKTAVYITPYALVLTLLSLCLVCMRKYGFQTGWGRLYFQVLVL